ncbi:MAG: hypothetical protein M3349_09115 [Actinomycetota bacterium]|nr:hypothetical protein [Actinomycetota bacterium]
MVDWQMGGIMVGMAGRKRAPEEPMVRGSVVVHRRRCGKATCRCADGESLHEAVVLSYSEAGRTRLLMLPAGEVARVRAAVDRYRAERARLDEAAEAGRAALVARLGQARRRR